MNIKKLFIPLFVSLITGCYHNPFLADTYQPIHHDINNPLPIEEALYNTSYFLQSKDLKSYELKEEIPGKNIVGTEVTTEIKTYTGFTFDEAHKDNITRGIVAKDDSLQLKLYYNRNKYTVTFDKNSETATGEMEPQSFYYAVSAKLSTNSFINTGYVFTGWAKTANATEADFTDGYSVSNLVTENNGNITLYAVWIEGDPIDYTIEYYLQTKDLSSYEKSKDKTLQNVADKEVTAQPESIDGFTFDKTNPENITSGTVSADSKLVLKLYYNRNKYTVTFDKNCETATGEMKKQTFYYGIEELKLNKNEFTDEYHDFLGWAETSDATDKKYKDEEILDFDLATGSGTLNLYAVWSAADPAVIKELAVKIPDSDKDLEDKAVISTSRNISVTFNSENAIKIYYSLGEESKEIKEESLDFADLTDGDYTFKIWAENIDGVKSEEKVFSWTIACFPKLRIKGISSSIFKIDTEINIDVSGDNLESCFYSLDGGDSTTDILLANNAGAFKLGNDTTGDFTLTVTGKNILDETTDKTFNWTVVETPVAVLSEIPQSLDSDTTFDITVSECDYYKYCLNSDEWSDVLESTTPIKIENLVANETYTLKVIGGKNSEYDENNFEWQSKETPTTVTWQIPSISLGDVLSTAYKVTGDEGIDGKNIYAHSDNNFIYFGYLDQKNEQQFCYDKEKNKITALCIAIWSDADSTPSIYKLDGIDQAGNENQPTLTINSQALTHFVRIVFDSETSGIPAFYKINNNKWIETDSSYINFKVMEGGQCAIAIPRSALNNPKSEVKYVIYMRDYKSGKIYAAYPTVSNSDNNYFINAATTLLLNN
ncbi:MAG: InlB B-repeat-containing protein [Spirochaetales bacterium]|nr:InlB B-repeat-containing protein [Spirochaetales bacterium]